jgi:tetratricopeptide (TPR) repeat protein
MKKLNSAGCRRTALVVLALGVGGIGWDARAAYVITTTGQRVDGSDIRAKSDGEIILTTPAGTRSFYPGQYTKAVVDKPAEIDNATKLIDARQYDEAIKVLEDVVIRYRFLDWDLQARALLPQVFEKKGDLINAVGAFEKLFAASPKSKEDPALEWSYRETLLKAKQYDKLETALNTVIAGGSRPDAARAQIMRGDIRASQGQLDAAVLDYLRTVVLFESEKDAQPEALFKAAETLKALRDPRADGFYKKLIEQYPGNPYSQKAESGK